MRAVLQWKFRVKGGGNTKWGGALKAIGKGGRDMSGVQKLTIMGRHLNCVKMTVMG